jgi:Arc/MetJ-type ribon-helix-helix transcriptional regulator
MSEIAKRKLHFAPLARQQKEIQRLLRAGRHRNVTELLRAALDHYLDNLGRPSLAEQARQMADDYARAQGAIPASAAQQDRSRASDELW